jgi:hypothetical protein
MVYPKQRLVLYICTGHTRVRLWYEDMRRLGEAADDLPAGHKGNVVHNSRAAQQITQGNMVHNSRATQQQGVCVNARRAQLQLGDQMTSSRQAGQTAMSGRPAQVQHHAPDGVHKPVRTMIQSKELWDHVCENV